MKVICIKNSISDVDKSSRLFEYLSTSYNPPEGELSVDVGALYGVYGLLVTDLGLWIVICEDVDYQYPYAYPMEHFTIDDPRLSRYWILRNGVRICNH